MSNVINNDDLIDNLLNAFSNIKINDNKNKGFIIFTKLCKKYLNKLHNLESIVYEGIIINYQIIKIFEDNTIRNNNDKNNKIRENIIIAIVNNKIPKEYYILSYFWNNLKNKLFDVLNIIFNNNLIDLECKKAGGRNKNYDFLISILDNDNKKINKKIEFKFNCEKIDKCPQFLSLSSKFNTNYTDIFYDNYLPQISKLYNIEIISKSLYNKHIYQTIYNKNIFFKDLYDNETKYIKEKKIIVDDSIDYYLKNNADKIDIIQLNNKFNESQIDKIYILYSIKEKKFFIDRLTDNELTLTGKFILEKNKQNYINKIIYETKYLTSQIHMLLRWRNHAGILNPAWQISIVRNYIYSCSFF